jgi:hypothetical protein
MQVSLQIENLAELRKLYKDEPVIAGEEVQRALVKAGNVLLRNTVKEEPIDTGKLRQSTHLEINRGEVIVRPAVDYAFWVHNGSAAVEGKLMAINVAQLSPRGRAKLGAGNKKGMIFFTKRRAIPPNPFLERAAALSRDQVADIFEEAAKRIIDRMATK